MSSTDPVAGERDRPGLIVVGSINEDHFVRLADFPQPGQTVLATGASTSLGGKGSNQAIAAALLGARVSFIGQLGDDAAGTAARSALIAYGIDVGGIVTHASAKTGTAYVTVNGTGENTIAVHSGANGAVEADVVAASLRVLLSGEALPRPIVLAQGELSPAVVDGVAEVARTFGARFILNLAPVIGVATETLMASDPLIVNEGEALELLERGGRGAPRDSGLGLAVDLAKHYSTSVVVTLGAAGAAVATADAAWVQPVLTSPRVVDTTGAGDAFVGALVATLCSGGTLAEAVRVGVAAGSHAVMAAGTAGSYATAAQLALIHN